MRILFVGDVVGRPGRRMLRESLPRLRREHRVDFVLVNGENAAGGNGITPAVYAELAALDVDAITLGNHTWDKRELIAAIDQLELLVRPANYPVGTPGRGGMVVRSRGGVPVGVINVMGRVFNPLALDCPFRAVERELEAMQGPPRIVVVDVHGEATSEKQALGWFLDGRVSLLVGTHTHVPTADAVVLPQGTAYVTDVGMTGPWESVIGVQTQRVLDKFLTQMPTQFDVARGPCQINAVLAEIDETTGLAVSIERLGWREPAGAG